MYVAMIRVTNRRVLVINCSNLVVLTTQRRHQHTSQEVGGNNTLKKHSIGVAWYINIMTPMQRFVTRH